LPQKVGISVWQATVCMLDFITVRRTNATKPIKVTIASLGYVRTLSDTLGGLCKFLSELASAFSTQGLFFLQTTILVGTKHHK